MVTEEDFTQGHDAEISEDVGVKGAYRGDDPDTES